MEQLILNIGLELGHEPVVVLDPSRREELIAQMAAAVVAVHEARKGENDDGLS